MSIVSTSIRAAHGIHLMNLLARLLVILPLYAAILVTVPVLADQSGPCAFAVSNGTATVNEYRGLGGAVAIPSTLAGYPVTAIDKAAFDHCTNLTSVAIPASVTSISARAFAVCRQMQSIAVDPANPSFCSLDGVLFDKTQTALIRCPGAKAGSYTIPASVRSIGNRAFQGCSALTAVRVPSSVTDMGFYAFADCANLQRVVFDGVCPEYSRSPGPIPRRVFDGTPATIYRRPMALGWYSFYQDRPTALWSADPQSGLPVLSTEPLAVSGPYAYAVADGQATITAFNLSSSRTQSSTNTINAPLYPARSLTLSITNTLGGFPVTTIGKSAFAHSIGLESVAIPPTVTTIGDKAFARCPHLTRVTIPGSVTNLGPEVFANCDRLASIDVQTANPAYGSTDGVLFDKARTVLIQYPRAKTGDYAIPGGVTSIVELAFAYCARLSGVTIPSSVAAIGDKTFMSCTNLTSVTIPSSVVAIGNSAFEGCTGLTCVEVPASVTSIGDHTFSWCVNLRRLCFAGNAPRVDTGAESPFQVYRDPPATVYYRPGTTGWGRLYLKCPTAIWTDAATDNNAYGKSETEKAKEKADLDARIASCKASITQIDHAVQIYAMKHKTLPSVLEDLTNRTDDNPALLKKESSIDIWGTPYAYSLNGKRFKITSAGPDLRFGTQDDITN